MTRLKVLYGVAGVVLALAILLAARSFSMAEASSRALGQRMTDLAELQALEREGSRNRAAIDAFEKLPQKSPVSLADLAKEVVKDAQASARNRDERPVADGWTLRTAEVTFENVKLEDATRFVAQAGAGGQSPPWRLAECSVTATDQPGYGRVTLLLEGLEKTASSR